MGFGESATQAIFFIASVVIALAIVGVVSISINSISNSFSAKAGQLSNQIKTGVAISGDSCYLGGSSLVYVKNTGSSMLDANSTDIFVDGAAYPTREIEIYKDNVWVNYFDLKVWAPGQLARFNTSSVLPTGYHKLRVVTQYGVFDSIEYSDC